MQPELVSTKAVGRDKCLAAKFTNILADVVVTIHVDAVTMPKNSHKIAVRTLEFLSVISWCTCFVDSVHVRLIGILIGSCIRAELTEKVLFIMGSMSLLDVRLELTVLTKSLCTHLAQVWTDI